MTVAPDPTWRRLDPAPPRASGGGVARVALVALLVLGAFVGLRLALHDGDLSTFVLAGDQVTDPGRAPAGLTVEPGVRGYDGQAFYRLARNPLTRQREEFGIDFARPAYRHQRIGYPVLAWVVSGGGRGPLVPGALIVVNLAAGAAIAALGARLALDAGRSAWLGLVPAGWAGYLIGLSLDLSEVVAGALLLAALLALRRARWGWAAVALTAGAITRETSLVLAAALLVTALVPPVRRRLGGTTADRPVPAWVPMVPLAAYGAWRLVLRWWWAGTGTSGEVGDAFLTAPLLRLGQRLLDVVRDPAAIDAGFLQLLLALAVVGVAVAALGDRRAGFPHERLALAGAAVLFACSPVWNLDVTFLRWADDTVMLGWLLALTAGRDRLRPLAALSAGLWALTAAVWIPFP